MPCLADMLVPLYNVANRDVFCWGKTENHAFSAIKHVFEISNVHNERNINLKFVILVRIRLNGFSGDWKRKK